MKMDVIECQGLEFACWIGFHDQEKLHSQNIKIDLQAHVKAFPNHAIDHPQHIEFDYYEATQLLQTALQDQKFLLIEALTHFVLQTLHVAFPKVLKFKITVSKFPLDMPNCERVSYTAEEEWL